MVTLEGSVQTELETHVTLEGLEPYVLCSPEPIDAFSTLADLIEMTNAYSLIKMLEACTPSALHSQGVTCA